MNELTEVIYLDFDNSDNSEESLEKIFLKRQWTKGGNLVCICTLKSGKLKGKRSSIQTNKTGQSEF